jgi:signal transduction histidine kinase
VHFKNPHLPHTRSEMALPLSFGEKALGAVTIQSVEERAFNEDDITTLQTMADHLAVAINNAYTLEALQAAHAELLRTKVFEALTVATTEAIHWIGNKALPITLTIARLKEDLESDKPDLESLKEDLDLIAESASQIVQVKEQLIGQAREQRPRPVLLVDVVNASCLDRGIDPAKLNVNVARDAACVLADSTQLVRALGNVLQNAEEAGAKHIQLEAGLSASKGKVNITITDDGAGMPTGVLETAWTPFVTTKAGHAGLGLPAALHVISQLQGEIHIISEPGKGTAVRVVLPVGQLQTASLGRPPLTCLIDDDDPWARSFVDTVGTVTRATRPDPNAELIVIDEYSAPAESVIEMVLKDGLGSKTVVVTAALNVDRMTRLLRRGIRNVVLKPYSPAEYPPLWE